MKLSLWEWVLAALMLALVGGFVVRLAQSIDRPSIGLTPGDVRDAISQCEARQGKAQVREDYWGNPVDVRCLTP